MSLRVHKAPLGGAPASLAPSRLLWHAGDQTLPAMTPVSQWGSIQNDSRRKKQRLKRTLTLSESIVHCGRNLGMRLVAGLALAALAVGCEGGNPAAAPPTTPPVEIPTLTWTERSDWINVKSHGAKGDGKTDDTAAIQGSLELLASCYAGNDTRYAVPRPVPSMSLETGSVTVEINNGTTLNAFLRIVSKQLR